MRKHIGNDSLASSDWARSRITQSNINSHISLLTVKEIDVKIAFFSHYFLFCDHQASPDHLCTMRLGKHLENVAQILKVIVNSLGAPGN